MVNCELVLIFTLNDCVLFTQIQKYKQNVFTEEATRLHGSKGTSSRGCNATEGFADRHMLKTRFVLAE